MSNWSPSSVMEAGSLFGMTCDGYDIIARNIPLPQGLAVGDWLVMAAMGSYTYGPKSTFNGMHSLDTVYVHNMSHSHNNTHQATHNTNSNYITPQMPLI